MATEMPPVAQFSLPTQGTQPTPVSSPTPTSGMPSVAQFSLPSSFSQNQPQDGSPSSYTTGSDGVPIGGSLSSNLARIPGDIEGAGNSLLPAIGDAYNDVTGQNKKTALQQAGDIGTTALTAALVIPGVDLLDLGALGAKTAGESALKEAPGLVSRLARGGIVGGAYGASGSLGAGQTDPTQIALSTAEGAAGGAATEGLLSKLLPKSSIGTSIRDTMPLENKATRIDALRSSLPSDANGGVVRKGLLGTSEIQPSEEDIARGTAADQYVSKSKDPVSKIQNLNQGIIDESKRTDTFLDQNAASANFEDMRNYVESNNTPDTNLQKDPAAYETYQRATESGLATLANVIRSASKETGDYGPQVSASLIRKARIDIDQQISRELGENTFGSPQYRGIKAAELGMRNTLNRMSEDMLRYPGQLENVNRMNEFVSSAKGRGIEVDMNNPQIRSQLENQFGLKATSQGEAAAQKLVNQHQKMSYLYEARDNLIDRYQRKIGKNKIQETIENSGPVTKGLINVGKKAIPFGIGEHVL